MTLTRWHRTDGLPPTEGDSHPFEDAAMLLMRAATLVLVAYLAAVW